MEELRGERKELTEGGRTIIREPDRTVIIEGGQTIIRHSEVDRFRYGARDVRMERHGNDTVTVVMRPDGDRVVTTLDENGFLLRRSRIYRTGARSSLLTIVRTGTAVAMVRVLGTKAYSLIYRHP